MYPLLIDVSHHQGEMDWDKAYAAGTRGAIIRAGSVSNEGDKPYKDREFDNNARRAAERMPVAYYWYFRPNRSPQIQADFFCNLIADKKFFRLWVDVEEHGGRSKDQVAEAVKIFIQRLKRNFGEKVGIYTRATFWNAYVAPSPDWGEYDLWIARYVPRIGISPWQDVANRVELNLKPREWDQWVLWQYSADGNGRGAEFGAKSGSIDINLFNGDAQALSAYCGAKIELPEKPEPVKEKTELVKPRGVLSVTASVLNVRANPSTHAADVGNLTSGARLYWYDEVKDPSGNRWLRVGPSAYVAEHYAGDTYAERIAAA